MLLASVVFGENFLDKLASLIKKYVKDGPLNQVQFDLKKMTSSVTHKT